MSIEDIQSEAGEKVMRRLREFLADDWNGMYPTGQTMRDIEQAADWLENIRRDKEQAKEGRQKGALLI